MTLHCQLTTPTQQTLAKGTSSLLQPETPVVVHCTLCWGIHRTVWPLLLLRLLLRLGLDPCNGLGTRLIVGQDQHVADLDMQWPAGIMQQTPG